MLHKLRFEPFEEVILHFHYLKKAGNIEEMGELFFKGQEN